MGKHWQAVISRNVRWSGRAAVAVAVAALASFPATTLAADATDDDKFSLSVGAFFVNRTDGQIRVDRSVGLATIGTSLDWQRDLGGDTSMTVPRIDGYFRFAPKHRIDFSYYRIDRGGQIVTQRGIDFGDVSFPAGTSISSDLLTETTKITYTYSFYRAPEIEASLSAGAHVTRISAKLESPGLGISEAESVTAPLPVFGFRLDYAMTPKWWWRSKYELFFLDSVDGFQGAYSDFILAIEHKTFEHVGFGFGINRNSLSVDVSKANMSGAFSSVLNGFMLYAVVH
jgi:hypothetical protein